jgi:integrase
MGAHPRLGGEATEGRLMTPRPKPFASKTYPNLFRYPGRSSSWVFRKYSSEKGKEFVRSTGEAKNEARAYRNGLEAFNAWLGRAVIDENVPIFGAYAARILALKLKQSLEDFRLESRAASERDYKYLIKHFGHLRVDQMTEAAWENHLAIELAQKRQTFSNRRKALVEIMRRAVREGIIRIAPEYKNPDKKARAGEYLDDRWVALVLAEADSDSQRLFYEILWRQGPRPREALRYRWDMIRWEEGPCGFIHIPAAISKTRRDRAIPLNPIIAKKLRERQGCVGWDSPFIFPARGNRAAPQTEYRKGWEGAKGRVVLRKEAQDLEGREGFERATIYALRGTFVTNALELGLSSTFVGKYIDSSSKMIDQRYAARKLSAMVAVANAGGAP